MGDYPKDVKDGITAGYIYGTVDQDPHPQGVESVKMANFWLPRPEGQGPAADLLPRPADRHE